jgi:cytoskeletal protein CcmA (bactofilin family)
MAKRNDVAAVASGETIIGAGVRVKGTLTSDSDITIDGRLDGEIKAVGTVNVGVNGIIRADITASNVMVGGQLKGNIDASGETVITSTGKVTGNIATSMIGIDPGAMFVGKVMMTKTTIMGVDEVDAPNDEGRE